MTHVVRTKVIKSPGDLNLLLGIEKGVGELLTLTQGALNDLKPGNIAQEIGHADIVAVRVAGGGGVRVLTGLDTSEAGVFAYGIWSQLANSFDNSHLALHRYHWHGRSHRWHSHWARTRHRDTLCVDSGVMEGERGDHRQSREAADTREGSTRENDQMQYRVSRPVIFMC